MKARWHGAPYPDRAIRKWLITFEVDECPVNYDETKNSDLSLDFKKFYKKRSLDANGYCWGLCSKIAGVLKTSKDEVYEEMIQRYAPFDRDEKGYITVTMLSRIPVKKLGGHWKLIEQNGKFNSYMKLVGSSEMDTQQMSKLLDGIISEAKELGIPTETPDEIERMKQQWGLEKITESR